MATLNLHDELAERSMIGAAIHSPELIDSLGLTEDHFFHHVTRTVFVAVSTIHASGKRPDAHSVIGNLGGSTIDKLGGHHELLSLCEYVHKSAALQLFPTLEMMLLRRRTVEVMQWAKAAIRGDDQRAFVVELQRKVANIDQASTSEDIMGKTCDEIDVQLDRMERGERTGGFQTSIETWNAAFGGISEGQMYAIASRPGCGKTALLEQIASDFVREDKHVLIFEKDMSPEKLVKRIACRECGVPFWKLPREMLRADEITRLRKMVALLKSCGLIHLYNPVGLTAEQLCAIVRREKRAHNIQCSFLDHVTALNVGKDYREGLTRASLTMRNHVTESGVPLVVLAHLNREAGSNKPTASHIKEFDQLFGDVDAMLLLWDNSNSHEDIRPIQFIVEKNRDCGKTETAVNFNGPLLKFINGTI